MGFPAMGTKAGEQPPAGSGAEGDEEQADPLEKDGVIGAFCRTYGIEDAIASFLPEVYQPSAMPGRFDYIPADSQAGVVVYDGKFVFSHHATDPACGKLMNVFDMVRIHKFGDLDVRCSDDTDVTKLSAGSGGQPLLWCG